MSTDLDTHIKAIITELVDAAPLAPPLPSPRAARSRRLQTLIAASAALALVAATVVVTLAVSGPHGRGQHVATLRPSLSPSPQVSSPLPHTHGHLGIPETQGATPWDMPNLIATGILRTLGNPPNSTPLFEPRFDSWAIVGWRDGSDPQFQIFAPVGDTYFGYSLSTPRDGSAVGSLYVTEPDPTLKSNTTFGLRFSRPLAWLNEPVGTTEVTTTIDSVYDVRLARIDAVSWTFYVGHHAGGPPTHPWFTSGTFRFLLANGVPNSPSSSGPPWAIIQVLGHYFTATDLHSDLLSLGSATVRARDPQAFAAQYG